MNIKDIIAQLDLQPLIEGGYYKQTYQSPLEITIAANTTRAINSAIYYLLESHDFSCWHRLKSDEIWHYYCGSELMLYQIHATGTLTQTLLGNPLNHSHAIPQYIVPADTWFAAEVMLPDTFTLTGTTVTPGFVFDDFEMGKYAELVTLFPQHQEILRRLTRL